MSMCLVRMFVSYRGGGISWRFNFTWEISRFKLTREISHAKFRVLRNSGFSANFSQTSSTHCGLWRGGQTLTPGGSAKFPTAKFTTVNLTWREIPPPPGDAHVDFHCYICTAATPSHPSHLLVPRPHAPTPRRLCPGPQARLNLQGGVEYLWPSALGWWVLRHEIRQARGGEGRVKSSNREPLSSPECTRATTHHIHHRTTPTNTSDRSVCRFGDMCRSSRCPWCHPNHSGKTHSNAQGDHEVRAQQQPPNAAHAERAISEQAPPSLYEVPAYSTRAGAAPRAPGGARHGGGNRAVTSQLRTGQSTSCGDVNSAYRGAGGWDRSGCAKGATKSANRCGEEQHRHTGCGSHTRRDEGEHSRQGRGAQQGRRGNQDREPEWRGWQSMCMGGSDNKGDGRPASPIATGCQGNPCSTGIRWGASPAAQMGCLRNRSGSPLGADQR